MLALPPHCPQRSSTLKCRTQWRLNVSPVSPVLGKWRQVDGSPELAGPVELTQGETVSKVRWRVGEEASGFLRQAHRCTQPHISTQTHPSTHKADNQGTVEMTSVQVIHVYTPETTTKNPQRVLPPPLMLRLWEAAGGS